MPVGHVAAAVEGEHGSVSFLPGSPPPPPLAASLAQGGTSQLPLFVENGFDQKPPIKSS